MFNLTSTEELLLCSLSFCLELVLQVTNTENFVVMTTKEICSKTTFISKLLKSQPLTLLREFHAQEPL